MIINPIIQKLLHTGGMLNRYTQEWNFRDKTLLLLFGFGESHLLGFHPGWEGFAPMSNSASRSQFCIPDGMIAETLESRLQTLFEFGKMMVDHGADLRFLSGPPPHKANETIAMNRPDLSFIPSPELRLRIYTLIREIFEQNSADHGVKFLDFSFGFADAEGFLEKRFEGDGGYLVIQSQIAQPGDPARCSPRGDSVRVATTSPQAKGSKASLRTE